jgi:hypothetical protein
MFSADAKVIPIWNKVELVTDDLKKLEARVALLVRQEFYSPGFVQMVVASVREVLGEFAVPGEAAEPSISANLTRLSEVSTFLSFSGPKLAGHSVLSASSGDLSAAYRARFPKVKFPDLDDLEDLIGEIANQIVGQIKRCVTGGSDTRMGLPLFIRGTDASIRHRAGAPTLSIDFANESQKVHVELCIHRLDGGPVTEPSNREPITRGSINFL